MSKLLLPVLVGVFIGAFTVELIRRNNPEISDALKARAKKVGGSLRKIARQPRRLTTTEGQASWKPSG